MPTVYESLRDDNQFTFICPLFNAKTRMGACTQLRDRVWRGERLEVRRGCQAAMQCGKCPAAEVVRKYCFDKTWTNDHHGSLVPKEGKIMKQILERIRPVMIREGVLNDYRVPEAERLLLATANQRIDEQLKTAPGESSRQGRAFESTTVTTRARKVVRPPEITTPASTAINEAAATGNLAAAINA